MLFATAAARHVRRERQDARHRGDSARANRAYKDVPAIAEVLPGYVAEVWYAVFAPGGTPPDVLAD